MSQKRLQSEIASQSGAWETADIRSGKEHTHRHRARAKSRSSLRLEDAIRWSQPPISRQEKSGPIDLQGARLRDPWILAYFPPAAVAILTSG